MRSRIWKCRAIGYEQQRRRHRWMLVTRCGRSKLFRSMCRSLYGNQKNLLLQPPSRKSRSKVMSPVGSFPWDGEFEDWYVMEVQWEPAAPIVYNSFLNSPFYPHATTVFSNIPVRKKSQRDLEFSFSSEVITGWRACSLVDYKRRGGVSETRLKALGMATVWE